MRRRSHLILVAFLGFATGTMLQPVSNSHTTRAQQSSNPSEESRIFINGLGIADASKHPPIPWERFTFFPANAQRTSFRVVPAGKTFILTDIMYNTRLTRQNLTVNFAKVTPDDKTQTLFQIYLKPGGQEETHLCTGYLIPSGYSVGAWTNAGLEPDQVVQITVTGYLVDEK